MFVDKANIHIKSGKGGDGAVSFYRAKYITHGGPDGGDGGSGGSIIIEGDGNMSTLMDFKYRRVFKAEAGEAGGKNNRSGSSAEDIIIKVPIGTVVKEANTGSVMADITENGMRKLLAKGGRGGRGNQHFATPSRQAPRYSEKGGESKEYDIILELKLIASVGLIGLPNVGKSSFLAMATNAKPKIANYRFTTLSPNLGVVRMGEGKEFVIADIPGLVEGASEGAGLGHSFLRHVERTKVFIHVVDAAALEGSDPVEDIALINKELENYNPELLKRPQIIAANKTDIFEAGENVARLKAAYEKNGTKVFGISAATGSGIDEVIGEAFRLLEDYPEDIVFEETYEKYSEIEPETHAFEIEKLEEGYFVISGTGIEKVIGYTNIDTEKGFAFFQKYLKDREITKALEEAGAKDGDTVRIYNSEFTYYK